MNKKKKRIQGVFSNRVRVITIALIAVVIMVILLSGYGVVQFMERSARDHAEEHVTDVVSRIDSKMNEVEIATRAYAEDAKKVLDNPDALTILVHNFVENTSFVYGSTIAFEPNYFSEKGECFAPYSWQTEDGQLHDRQLGEDTIYFEEEWFAVTRSLGTEYWCEPYFDEGGAKIKMCTFSIPLKNNDGKVVAVLTSDVGLDDLELYISTLRPYEDSWIVVRSQNGSIIVNEELGNIDKRDSIIIRNIAEIGWSVELSLPFNKLLHGDNSIPLILGAILLITALVVYLMYGLLTFLQQRSSKEYMNIIGAMTKDFPCVDYVELSESGENDRIIQYRVSDKMNEIIPTWKDEKSCHNRFQMLYDNVVLEQEKEQFLELTKRNVVLQKLAENDTYFINFRAFFDNKIQYYQIKITAARNNDELVGFVIGLHSIDEQMRKTIEQQNQLQLALENSKKEAERNDLIINVLDAGKWSYEIDENDQVISRTYSDSIYTLAHTSASSDPMNWINFVEKDERERVLEEFNAAIKDHSGNTLYDTTFNLITPANEIRYVRSIGRVIRRNDGTGELFGMNLDLTSQVEEQNRHQRELKEALDAAQSANKAKTDFLFNMSHDIRTPMNAIIGFTNLAKKYIDDKNKVLDSLTKTQEAGELLLSLINDILDMSRIESGKIHVEQNPGDVYLSFSNIESTMLELAKAKNLGLNFEYGHIDDRYVYADFTRCIRVFVNIITNAIKYTPTGGNIIIRCEQIGREKDIATYKYTFKDNGIGMSEEFQKRVFDEFAREETATVSGIQGTGLGLAVCKSFVTAMNGTISVESKQGEGSTFTVILPFKVQEGKEHTDPLTGKVVGEKEQKVTKNESLVGKRILLVEDNALNREIVEEILTDEGIIVESANDGSVSVDLLREKGPDYYDFILMDIQMPIMNGYEATGEIRNMYPGKNIPIIALSANAFEEDKIKSRMAGMNDHIAKPIDVDVLKETLQKFIK